jgi:beta-mannosidase
MGTLYWQLNDTWPVVSWSGRDYFGRLKALHYAAREAFAPTLISTVLLGDTLEVWGTQDPGGPIDGTLDLEITDFDGLILWEVSVPVSLGEGRSRILWKGSRSLLGEADPRRVVFSAGLTGGPESHALASSLFFYHPPKELELSIPTIALDLVTHEEGASLTLQTDILAKDVYLQLAGGRFSDNFFDLLPGRSRTVLVRTDKTLGEVRAELTIRTLAEVPREGQPVDPPVDGGR